MIEAKFNLGDEAVMMYDNAPVRVFVKDRLFIRREYGSMFVGGEPSSSEYMEYIVFARKGTELRVHESQLFKTKEELFESFGKE